MLMGLTVPNDRSQSGLNSYTASASLQSGLESLVMPSADLNTAAALDNSLDVTASNGANLREYATTLLQHEQMMAGFKDLSFSSRSFVQSFSNAA
jgi:hypothetical protein